MPEIAELLLAYGANPNDPGVQKLAATINDNTVSAVLTATRVGRELGDSV